MLKKLKVYSLFLFALFIYSCNEINKNRYNDAENDLENVNNIRRKTSIIYNIPGQEYNMIYFKGKEYVVYNDLIFNKSGKVVETSGARGIPYYLYPKNEYESNWKLSKSSEEYEIYSVYFIDIDKENNWLIDKNDTIKKFYNDKENKILYYEGALSKKRTLMHLFKYE